MTYDYNYVEAQVRRAIEAAPTKIKVTRDSWISDGYGGKKRDESKSLVLDNAICLFEPALTYCPMLRTLVEFLLKMGLDSSSCIMTEEIR